jgi:hypothetical protein
MFQQVRIFRPRRCHPHPVGQHRHFCRRGLRLSPEVQIPAAKADRKRTLPGFPSVSVSPGKASVIRRRIARELDPATVSGRTDDPGISSGGFRKSKVFGCSTGNQHVRVNPLCPRGPGIEPWGRSHKIFL